MATTSASYHILVVEPNPGMNVNESGLQLTACMLFLQQHLQNKGLQCDMLTGLCAAATLKT